MPRTRLKLSIRVNGKHTQIGHCVKPICKEGIESKAGYVETKFGRRCTGPGGDGLNGRRAGFPVRVGGFDR
jgi:hypothetical protein